MAQPDRPPTPRTDRSPWNWLLFIPIVVPLLVVLFNGRAAHAVRLPAVLLAAARVHPARRRHHHARLPADQEAWAVTGMWRDHLTEIIITTALFLLVSGMGFVAARWRRAGRPAPPRRVGPGRAQLRRLGHLVPGRRRPLHGVHLRRRTGAAVRRRRDRLLRRAVHGHHLPAGVPGAGPAVVGVAPARLRDAGRLRAVPVGLVHDGAAGRDHRHRRHHAVHRAAAGRHRVGAQGDARTRARGR